MTKTKSNPTNHTLSLTSALDFIAETLSEIQIREDDDGSQIEVNTLAYAQRRVLNGIAYSTALTLSSSEKSYDEAVSKVRYLTRTHRNDEISELNLQRAIQWCERLEMQIAALSDLLEVATEVHNRHTGEKFKFQPVVRAEKKFQTSALEAAAKYANPNETILEGGVDADESKAA